MDKKLAGLLGAVAGLAAMSSAQAAPNPSEALQATSYADLLAPIPNAAALLKVADAAQAQEPAGDVQLAQYNYYTREPYYQRQYYRHHHHHHHHHHHQYRRGEYIGVPGLGGVVIQR